jgi:hypothetical protein
MIRKFLLNPTVILYFVNALLALAVAWGWHLSTTEAGAVDTITTGVLTIADAFLVQPVSVAVIMSAAATVVTAFAAFGLDVSADRVTATAAVISAVLGLALYWMGVPNVAAEQGVTAQQLLLLESSRVPAAHP